MHLPAYVDLALIPGELTLHLGQWELECFTESIDEAKSVTWSDRTFLGNGLPSHKSALSPYQRYA